MRATAAPTTISRRRLLGLLAASIGGTALAAACAPAAQAPAPTAAPAKPAAPVAPTAAPALKSLGQASQVMNWFAQPSQGGQFAAVKLGLYKAQGIDMTIEQGGPGISSIPLVASGKHTFGMSGADAILLARAEGIPVVAVFSHFQTNPQGFMYHQESGIKSFEDLNGKKVYVAQVGSHFWPYIKAKYNLDKAEQFAYNGQLATWMSDKNNVTQCFVISEPYFAREAGANPGTLLNADSGFNPYQNLMFTTEQTIKEKPELVRAFVQASAEGWKRYIEDPKAKEETFAFIKSFNKDQVDDAMEWQYKEQIPFILGGDAKTHGIGSMSLERWKATHDQLREIGVLKKDLDVKAAFTLDFLQG